MRSRRWTINEMDKTSMRKSLCNYVVKQKKERRQIQETQNRVKISGTSSLTAKVHGEKEKSEEVKTLAKLGA